MVPKDCRGWDEGRWQSFLKATVKATPVDAYVQGSTIQHVGVARRIQNDPGWTSADTLTCNSVELQNRWSASLAMSTDGSFPSRPRQFRIRLVTAAPGVGD
jgi:hypothetical protein